MDGSNDTLLSATRNYVTELFIQKMKPELVFHSLSHTEDVVEACSYMADHYQLQGDERDVLMVAAWFHDTGYSDGHGQGHEDKSIKLATEFLQSQEVDDKFIQRVSSAIAATRMPQSPVSQIEKILCDADLYHLATKDFKAKGSLLKQEREWLLHQKISKKDWRANNEAFLESHKYFTEYGQKNLEPKKQENLRSLKKKKDRKEEEETAAEMEAFPYMYGDLQKQDQKTADKNTERGVQTMFRTTSTNHFELSTLADGKANIMISVNAIIISVVLTILIVRLPYYPNYILPTIVLMATCLGAMIFAILATRPSINSGVFNEDDIRAKKTNLLFFGNFHQMKLEEYEWGMNELLKDKEYLYNSMIKDIYFLGVVLAKKYKLLRISYTIFMFGLILSVIAFVIGFMMGGGSTGTTIDY
ncbi:MAG TPA: Pycsar system effector family protein [Flavisolibacter sp.]|jgi:predicted metal-dependent HD superfamily phosphohydrolase|nr:Pycsar system effector family protein [Flavisolibacter sp.]